MSLWNWKNKGITYFNELRNRCWWNVFVCQGPKFSKISIVDNKRENLGLKRFNDSKGFIDHSNDMGDIYKNNEKYNQTKNVKYSLHLMVWLLICLLTKKLAL